MRRALCIMLAVMMLFSLVACRGSLTVAEDNKTKVDDIARVDTSGDISDNTTSDNSRTTEMSDATRELLDSINVDNAEAMGFCGADITWYYMNNVLVLKGTGRMTDFSSDGRPYENVLPSVNRVIIEDGITYVSASAFCEEDGIAAVYLSNTLEEIGKYAFFSCNGLTSINIPDSVTYIDDMAFDGCTGLTRVDISDIAAWCNISFSSHPFIDGIGSLYLNNNIVTDLVIPNEVTKIRKYVFCGCTSLTSINIPDSVTSIESGAFYRCTGLTSINIPDSVTSIGYRAFYECTGLTSITIPDSVTSIGEDAFDGCTGLTIYYHSSAVDEIVSEYPEFNWVKQ